MMQKLALIVIFLFGAVGSAIGQVDSSIAYESEAALRAYAIEFGGADILHINDEIRDDGSGWAEVTYEPEQIGSVGCLAKVRHFQTEIGDDGDISWGLRETPVFSIFWQDVDSCQDLSVYSTKIVDIIGETKSDRLEQIIRSKQSMLTSMSSMEGEDCTIYINSPGFGSIVQDVTKGSNYYRVDFSGFWCRRTRGVEQMYAYVDIRLVDSEIEILDVGYKFYYAE